MVSHPSWVRGLKRFNIKTAKLVGKSHPSWVRGLKLYVALGERLGGTVAPLAGAWIETIWC